MAGCHAASESRVVRFALLDLSRKRIHERILLGFLAAVRIGGAQGVALPDAAALETVMLSGRGEKGRSTAREGHSHAFAIVTRIHATATEKKHVPD